METNNILLVDDVEENLFSLESMLAGEGRFFFKALSGNDALKIAYKEEISLILMDVQMPEMDGFVTARLLKSNAKTRKIPIVFVTAINKDQHYVIQGLDEGAIDYLFKPLDISVTRSKVATLLQLYRQQIELEKKNKELQLLNQEKNRLLGIAAHDLRNPLGNIIFLSDFIMDERERLSEDQLKFLNMIQGTGTYMLNLIDSLLDVSIIESGNLDLKLSEVNIVDMIQKTIDIFKIPAGKKNMNIVFEKEEANINATLDEGKIIQVMNNLISNAIKFSKPDTTIFINTGNKNGQLFITVEDQGQGIAKEEMGKLFKFFSRTSTISTHGEKSTGLGLAISLRIVEAHKGKIDVQSELGKGTVFSVNLPA